MNLDSELLFCPISNNQLSENPIAIINQKMILNIMKKFSLFILVIQNALQRFYVIKKTWNSSLYLLSFNIIA